MVAISIIFLVLVKFIYVYSIMILARCLLTWIPGVNWSNPILSALKSSVDLYLDLFRKIIPPVGPFDFSPIVAIIVLTYIPNVLSFVLNFILQIIGS